MLLALALMRVICELREEKMAGFAPWRKPIAALFLVLHFVPYSLFFFLPLWL